MITLSKAQRATLVWLAANRANASYAPSHLVLHTLQRRGLVDGAFNITQLGRDALAGV